MWLSACADRAARSSSRARPKCSRSSAWPTRANAFHTNSRAASSNALAPEPALLLLDEPFSNLDGGTRERLTAEVRGILKRAGQTAILVTHNDAEAHAMADRIGVMHAGRITHWLDAAK
jgi:ABC-type Fe3+/spermidine/putrescine transport system ATPase subunit